MKHFGRILMATALLTTVTAFVGGATSGAATSMVTAPSVTCGLEVIGLFNTTLVATNVDATLSAPDTVTTGSTAALEVKLGGNPGFANGPLPFENGTAEVFLAVNGETNPANYFALPPQPLPTPIAANAVIQFPDFTGSSAAISSPTTFEVARVRYANSQAIVDCPIPVGDRANVTVTPQAPTTTSTTTTSSTVPGQTTSSTTSTTTSTTSTTTSTTSTTTSTTTTTAKPTTTTAPPSPPPAPPGEAKIKQVTKQVVYNCNIVYQGGATIKDQKSPVAVTLSAPDRATVGSKYDVYMDIKPGIGNGPVAIPAGSVTDVISEILVGAPGTPSKLTQSNGPVASEVPGGGSFPVKQQKGTITAAGKNGDKVAIKAGPVVVKTKVNPPTLPNPGTVTCTPESDTTISTALTDEVLKAPSSPPPAAPPAPAAPAPAAGPSSPATPTPAAAPVTADGSGSGGVQAQVLSKTGTIEYSCEIYSGSNLITTQKDTQQVTIKTVDKVSPGGTLSFQMTLDPGPKTGPVPLPNGVKDMTVSAVVGGGGSPSTVSMPLGDLTAAVGTNSPIKVPTASGSVNVTGAVGETVTLTGGDMTFSTERPPSRTDCKAQNPAVITTTEIAEGVDVASADAARLALTGSSRGWLVPFAVSQLVLGLGLVLVHRRRTALL